MQDAHCIVMRTLIISPKFPILSFMASI